MQNPTEVKLKLNMLCVASLRVFSLRASSPVWASETALARTRERAAKAQIGELASRLASFKKCPRGSDAGLPVGGRAEVVFSMLFMSI